MLVFLGTVCLRLGTVPLTFYGTLWVVFCITLDALRTVDSASQTVFPPTFWKMLIDVGKKSSQIMAISISNALRSPE